MPSPSASEYFDLATFSHRALWSDGAPVWAALSSLGAYLAAAKYTIEIDVPASVHLEGLVAIGAGTVIEPGVYIQGPCLIGRNCHIRHGAFLRGGFVSGDHCVVGHATEIKSSILLNGAQIAHLDYVGDSLIGHRVNLGAGVKCANLRLDRREVSVLWEGQKVKTGLKKFGCVIGDGAQIGCNVVINPGTLIGRECVSHPLLNLQGTLPARTRIKSKSAALDLAPLEHALLDWMRQ